MKPKPSESAPAPLVLNAYQMSDILESGLLSPERIAEIEAAMATDTSPVFDKSGALAVNAKIITLGGKRKLILENSDSDFAKDYHRRLHFAEFLTQDEIKLLNDHAFEARQERRDAERFEKAEKIDAADWPGWVCDGGDQYHSSVEEWLDSWACYLDPDDDLPTHVWAAEPEMVLGKGLDVEDILESDIEARGWEDMSSDDFAGTAELQAALDHFVYINRDVVSYRENTKKAILVESLCRAHVNELAAVADVAP